MLHLTNIIFQGFLAFSTLIYALCMKTMSSMANSGLDLNMSSGMAE